MTRIRGIAPDAELTFLRYDQADLGSIRQAVHEHENEPLINVLINNAGVMNPPLSRTRRGFELQFGINHLGCFAFTSFVLPRLAGQHCKRRLATCVQVGITAHRVSRKFAEPLVKPPSPACNRSDFGPRLWDASVSMNGIDPGLAPLP